MWLWCYKSACKITHKYVCVRVCEGLRTRRKSHIKIRYGFKILYIVYYQLFGVWAYNVLIKIPGTPPTRIRPCR